MKLISDRELYELYLDTIRRCTGRLIRLSDEEISYELFEEFDAEATTLLHDDSLARLKQAGYLTQELVEASTEIRRRWFELQTAPSEIAQIKSSHSWRDLFQRCDGVMAKLRNGPPSVK